MASAARSEGSPPSAPRAPAAQLQLQRSGVVTWYRRLAGELWSLTPRAEDFTASVAAAPPGAWLGTDARGAPVLWPPELGGGEVLALLQHPRSGARWLGTAAGLCAAAQPVSLAGGITALAWAADLHRLYAATADGAVWAVPLSPVDPGTGAEAAPVLLAHIPVGEVPGLTLALGPAGLVAATAQAVFGINLRHGTAAQLFRWRDEPAAAQAPPAVAVDHARFIYLADDRSVTRCRGDGGELVRRPLCALDPAAP